MRLHHGHEIADGDCVGVAPAPLVVDESRRPLRLEFVDLGDEQVGKQIGRGRALKQLGGLGLVQGPDRDVI